MRHEPLESELCAYLEGWLSHAHAEQIEAHLRECPACQAKVAGWEQIADALRTLSQLPAPARRRIALPPPHTSPIEQRAIALIALFMLLLMGSWFSKTSLTHTPQEVAQWTPLPMVSRLTTETRQIAQTVWGYLTEEVR